MIGRRGFITGMLASAAMPMLIDKHRVVLVVGLDYGPDPQMVVMKFIGEVEHYYMGRPANPRLIPDSQFSHVERCA